MTLFETGFYQDIYIYGTYYLLQAFSDDDDMGGDIPEGFTADDLLSDSESEQTSAKLKTKKQTTESKNKKEKRRKKKGSALEDDIDDDEKVGEAFTTF